MKEIKRELEENKETNKEELSTKYFTTKLGKKTVIKLESKESREFAGEVVVIKKSDFQLLLSQINQKFKQKNKEIMENGKGNENFITLKQDAVEKVFISKPTEIFEFNEDKYYNFKVKINDEKEFELVSDKKQVMVKFV